jgi:hypothetical protein
VKGSHASNHKKVNRPTFVSKMVEEIKQKKVKILRIHVTGDLYDAKYIRDWIKIASKCPDTRFYAFTRSWRITRLMPALTDFSKLPNTQLWWSADADTHVIDGRPPIRKGVRVAYMQVHDEEHVPAYTDLVLRVKRNTLVRFTNGRLVCLAENGMEYAKRKMTCERCKLCFTDREVPKKACSRSREMAHATTT